MIDLRLGNNLEVLKEYPDNYFDSVITDPPYGLKFMAKKWDYDLPSVALWQEVLRVSKPGATLLSFGGTRTFHRLACTIEDAGWEIFDCVIYMFGQGFPKSHNISKAIDREKGMEREITDRKKNSYGREKGGGKGWAESMITTKQKEHYYDITTPNSELAKQFDGWGTALKPAYEPVIVARKPNDGTFAENAEKWGVSGLWIDGARIPTLDDLGRPTGNNQTCFQGLKNIGHSDSPKGLGRWPANIILDEEAGKMLDKQAYQNGDRASDGDSFGTQGTHKNSCFSGFKDIYLGKQEGYGKENCGPSRFFYTAKASKSEREEGLEDFNQGNWNDGRKAEKDFPSLRRETKRSNVHPTIKPIKLMEYLCKLTKTPTGGHVLDPFMGSGTTGIACLKTGRDFTGIEISEEYFKIAKARIDHWNPDTEEETKTETKQKFKQGELF